MTENLEKNPTEMTNDLSKFLSNILSTWLNHKKSVGAKLSPRFYCPVSNKKNTIKKISSDPKVCLKCTCYSLAQ